MNQVGDKIEHNGVQYVAENERGESCCHGCAAQQYGTLCMALPRCRDSGADVGIIWVRVE